MKKIIIAIIGLASLTSCRLDLQPESDLIYTNYWKSEEAVNVAQRGIYVNFRNYAYTLWRLGEVRSDVWGGPTLESSRDLLLIDNNITVNNVQITNWGAFYGLLHNINDFIKNAPTVPTENQNDRNHLMGQMHGMRAYIYYTLLKTWGEVPITTTPLDRVTDVALLNKPRSSKQEVAALIKEDIQKSLEYFGSNNRLWTGRNVFWSKSATLALKGESYIFFGSELNEGAVAYTEAKNALSQITGFSLVPSFSDLWGVENENNREFIFAIDYQLDQAGGYHLGAFTGNAKDVNTLYDKNGNSMAGWVGTGGSVFSVSNKVLERFANEPNDTRGDATLLYLYSDNNGGAGYSTYNRSKLRTTMLNKFLGEIVNSTRQSYANVPIYRYADVLLLLAEAKNRLGEDPSAEINAIRQRAFGASAVTYTNGTQAQNTQAILDERLKEFIGEGKRWWDLQRAGSEWVKREVASFNNAPISGDAKKIYWPISITMMDNDPNLKQTEGY